MLRLRFPIQDTKCHVTLSTDDRQAEPLIRLDLTPDREHAMLETIFGSLFCDSFESQRLLVEYLERVMLKLEDEVAFTTFKRRVAAERLEFVTRPPEKLEES